MNGWIHLESPGMLHLLWLLPVAGVLVYLSGRVALRATLRLTALRDALAPADPSRRAAGAALVMAAVGLIAVALARPGWDPKPVTVRQTGRDVAFVVDVSLSMLAEDLVPARLERAKAAIRDTIPMLDGDRVALVAFAGSTRIVCPLTRDYGFFRWAVDGLSRESTDTEGTLIGDAIRKTSADVFDPREKRFKDLVLVSDGEDQESFPTQAAIAAGAEGVRIIAIGIGDDVNGARIPVDDGSGKRTYLTYQGSEVVSRLQGGTLRDIAAATPGGRYLNAATGAFDLGGIYRQLIQGEMKRDLGPIQVTRYPDRFQLFLFAALALLAAEMLFAARRRGTA